MKTEKSKEKKNVGLNLYNRKNGTELKIEKKNESTKNEWHISNPTRKNQTNMKTEKERTNQTEKSMSQIESKRKNETKNCMNTPPSGYRNRTKMKFKLKLGLRTLSCLMSQIEADQWSILLAASSTEKVRWRKLTHHRIFGGGFYKEGGVDD